MGAYDINYKFIFSSLTIRKLVELLLETVLANPPESLLNENLVSKFDSVLVIIKLNI